VSRTAKTEEIARSIGRQLGDDELVAKLAALMPSELNALLLAVHRAHTHAWPDVAAQFARARAFEASRVDARALHALQSWFLDAAVTGGFEAVALAPVAPHGLAALTGIDPNNVVTGTRSSEVLADPTAVMALEIARRIRARSGGRALAAVARVLRMQPLPTGPGTEHYSQHFGLCALTTGVRSRVEAVAAVAAHLRVWTRVIERAAREARWDVELVRVELAGERGWFELVHDLARAEPELARVPVVFADDRAQGRGYYRDCLLRVVAAFPGKSGARDELFIGDGGVVDWSGRILSDAKERLVTSGLGAELFVKRAAPR
jgi:hypothetical protein